MTMQITRAKYDAWVNEFNNDAEKNHINYDYRHALVGDEEETRIIDDYNYDKEQYLSRIPEEIRDNVQSILEKLIDENTSWDDEYKLWEQYIELLAPYTSCKELREHDYGIWEEVLWASGNELTYDQFKENNTIEDTGWDAEYVD